MPRVCDAGLAIGGTLRRSLLHYVTALQVTDAGVVRCGVGEAPPWSTTNSGALESSVQRAAKGSDLPLLSLLQVGDGIDLGGGGPLE